MNAEGRQLFRSEAVRARTDRLHGEVSLALPLSWQAIGFLLLAGLVAAAAFLFMTSYSRVENVTGEIALDRGVASIVPSRPGVVAGLDVREGQRIRAGAPLVRIRSEEDMLGGATASARIRRALAEQDSRLSAQGDLVLAAGRADRGRLAAQIDGLAAEIASLDQQIADQKRLVQVAANDFAEVQRVAGKGFISRRDVDAREAMLISRRQQLSQLQQSRGAKLSQLTETRRSMAQAGASAEAQAASAQSSRAALAQQLAMAELGEGYVLTAPLDGIATGITARPGQPVTAEQQLMMILPEKATPTALLHVPTAAAGFLSPGQEVRLAVDAFPYQRFGTVDGRIESISAAATVRRSGDTSTSVYLVTVRLPRPWIEAFGRRHRLLPGMTLSARIVTERRSLFEWLFEPIFAVGKR